MDHDDEMGMCRELRAFVGTPREHPTTALHPDRLAASGSRGNVDEERDNNRANGIQD